MDPTVPNSVRCACWLYLASLALLVLFNILSPTSSSIPTVSVFDQIIGTLVTLGVLVAAPTIFLLSQILRRRNWARLVLAGWSLVAAAFFGSELVRSTEERSWTSGAIETFLELAALALLFTRSSREWFRVS